VAHHSSRVQLPLGLCSNRCIFKDIVEGCVGQPNSKRYSAPKNWLLEECISRSRWKSQARSPQGHCPARWNIPLGNQEVALTVCGWDRVQGEHLRSDPRHHLRKRLKPPPGIGVVNNKHGRLVLVSHWYFDQGGKLSFAGGTGSIYTQTLGAGDTCLVDIRLFVICTNCAISTTEPPRPGVSFCRA